MKIRPLSYILASKAIALCLMLLPIVVGCEGRDKIVSHGERQQEPLAVDMSLYVSYTTSHRIELQLVINNWNRDQLYLYDIDECGVYHHTLHSTKEVMFLEDLDGASTNLSLRSLQRETDYFITPFVCIGDNPSKITRGEKQKISTTYY